MPVRTAHTRPCSVAKASRPINTADDMATAGITLRPHVHACTTMVCVENCGSTSRDPVSTVPELFGSFAFQGAATGV